MEPLENHMVIDAEWPEYDEEEEEREDMWTRLCREADDAYDSRWDFEWQN